MIHAKAFAAELRLAENYQLLLRENHFLNVMQIKPAKRQRLTKRVRVRLLQYCLEYSAPAEAAKRGLDHLARQTNRLLAFLAREFRKLMSIFVTARIVRQQIFNRGDAKPPQREKFWPRDPIDFLERVRDLHYLIGSAPRKPSTRMSR